MQAGQPEPAVLEGLSRFLIVHERCGAGFDVAHPAGVGSGRVSITCRGCGARHEYMTSTVEIEREISFQLPTSGAATPVAPEPTRPEGEQRRGLAKGAPAPTAPSSGASAAAAVAAAAPAAEAPRAPEPAVPPTSEAADGPAGRRLTGARAGTIALLLIAVIAVIVAVVRLSGGSDEDSAAPADVQASQPATEAGRGPGGGLANGAPQPSGTDQGGTSEDAGSGGTGGAQRQPLPRVPDVPLRTVSTDRYSLAVPVAWTSGNSGSALQVTGAGGAVTMLVYADTRPDLGLAEMGRLTADLLRRDHPAAKVSATRRTSVGGADALTLTARFPGGSEIAYAIAEGSQRYLILETLDSGSSRAARAEARAIAASFEPR